jgi:hypothetical protein
MQTRRQLLATLALVPAALYAQGSRFGQIAPPFTAANSPYPTAKRILQGDWVRPQGWRRPSAELPSLIHAQFATVIEQNLARLDDGRFSTYLGTASEHELASLFAAYHASLSASGQAGRLYPLLAERAEPRELSRLWRHAASAELEAAVAQVDAGKAAHLRSLVCCDGPSMAGPDAVASTPVLAAPPQAGAASTMAILLEYTVEEIYLHYRTAPFGSVSVRAALYMTTAHVGGHLLTAFGAGYAVGQNAVAPVIQRYMPSLWNSIGAGVAGMVQLIGGADGLQAQAFAQRDTGFGFHLTPFEFSTLQATGGDFGIVSAWSVVYGGSGSGGGSLCGIFPCELSFD